MRIVEIIIPGDDKRGKSKLNPSLYYFLVLSTFEADGTSSCTFTAPGEVSASFEADGVGDCQWASVFADLLWLADGVGTASWIAFSVFASGFEADGVGTAIFTGVGNTWFADGTSTCTWVAGIVPTSSVLNMDGVGNAYFSSAVLSWLASGAGGATFIGNQRAIAQLVMPGIGQCNWNLGLGIGGPCLTGPGITVFGPKGNYVF